jgi:hypothetical protein
MEEVIPYLILPPVRLLMGREIDRELALSQSQGSYLFKRFGLWRKLNSPNLAAKQRLDWGRNIVSYSHFLAEYIHMR